MSLSSPWIARWIMRSCTLHTQPRVRVPRLSPRIRMSSVHSRMERYWMPGPRLRLWRPSFRGRSMLFSASLRAAAQRLRCEGSIAHLVKSLWWVIEWRPMSEWRSKQACVPLSS